MWVLDPAPSVLVGPPVGFALRLFGPSVGFVLRSVGPSVGFVLRSVGLTVGLVPLARRLPQSKVLFPNRPAPLDSGEQASCGLS